MKDDFDLLDRDESVYPVRRVIMMKIRLSIIGLLLGGLALILAVLSQERFIAAQSPVTTVSQVKSNRIAESYTFGWRERTPTNNPPALINPVMSFDDARGVTVLFGDYYDTVKYSGTWEWDGIDWLSRTSVDHPPSDIQPAMAYDSARDVVVLFGAGQTWEWDGNNWSLRTPAHQPPARYSHAMAYDGERKVTVLFGGDFCTGICPPPDEWMVPDTWEWDGIDWIQRTPANHPPARSMHAMAYDDERDVVVLYGGYYPPDHFYREDTWEWDGTDWVERLPDNYPSKRFGHTMVYDGIRNVTVLFGGESRAGELGDTWEWDGVDWTQSNYFGPGPRSFSTMAFDSVRGMVVLFGGWSESELAHLDDTWEYGPPLSRPVLLPVDNLDGNGDYLIDWRSVMNATMYTLVEADNIDFIRSRTLYQGSVPQVRVTGQPGGTWYYRVRAEVHFSSHSYWSNVELVSVVPDPLTLLDISNDDLDNDYLIDWDDTPGPVTYTLQEDDDPAFAFPGTVYQGATSQFQVTNHPGGSWYYRVRAQNAAGDGPWSNVESVNARPLSPTLSTTVNPDRDGDYRVEWADVIGADTYYLEEDQDVTFPSPVVICQGAESYCEVTNKSIGVWYYRARAGNSWGSSLWSPVESVEVGYKINLPCVRSVGSSPPTPTPTSIPATPTPIPTIPSTRTPAPPTPTPTHIPNVGDIAFSGADADKDGIFMMDVDGSNLQYVCDGREPAWSPDGQKIAFSKLGTSKYIHVVNADGSNDQSLDAGTAPDWSPDGQLIVFVRDDGLWVMDANGQGARPITSTGDNWGSWRDNNPAWSPDGLWIVFDSSRNPDHVLSPTVHELWLMRASGGTPFRLTDDPGHTNRMPSWSPDGQTIVFSRDSDIYTIDVDGSNMTSLTNNTNVEVERYPTWSPDGLWIAFELVSDTGRDVCKMDTVGLFKTCLTNSLWGWNPDWKN